MARVTLKMQMELYNALVDEAVAKGLKFRRLGEKNGTTFATRAQGEKAIAKIRQALLT